MLENILAPILAPTKLEIIPVAAMAESSWRAGRYQLTPLDTHLAIPHRLPENVVALQLALPFDALLGEMEGEQLPLSQSDSILATHKSA